MGLRAGVVWDVKTWRIWVNGKDEREVEVWCYTKYRVYRDKRGFDSSEIYFKLLFVRIYTS